MPAVWIENLSNLHCPTCDARLVARAGRFQPMGKKTPTYQQDGRSLNCPNGHPLPDVATLDRYAVQHGHQPPPEGTPVREVPPPR